MLGLCFKSSQRHKILAIERPNWISRRLLNETKEKKKKNFFFVVSEFGVQRESSKTLNHQLDYLNDDIDRERINAFVQEQFFYDSANLSPNFHSYVDIKIYHSENV